MIIAKVNLSEFASAGALSTLGGQILPPRSSHAHPAVPAAGSGAGIADALNVMAGAIHEVRPTRLIKDDGVTLPPKIYSGTAILANVTGWPNLIVSASFTSDPGLPVGLSFIGPAFSEARLLALGYAFEQANPARTLPVTTPMPLASSSSSDRRYASPPRHFFGISFS